MTSPVDERRVVVGVDGSEPSRLALQWAQFMAHYNPFFYNIDGFRYGFLGQETTRPLIGILVLIGLNAVLFVWTYRMIKSGYKLKA